MDSLPMRALEQKLRPHSSTTPPNTPFFSQSVTTFPSADSEATMTVALHQEQSTLTSTSTSQETTDSTRSFSSEDLMSMIPDILLGFLTTKAPVPPSGRRRRSLNDFVAEEEINDSRSTGSSSNGSNDGIIPDYVNLNVSIPDNDEKLAPLKRRPKSNGEVDHAGSDTGATPQPWGLHPVSR